MQDFLAGVAANHEYLVYVILFLIAVVEGPIVSVAGGILIKLGDMPFLPVYLTVMAGDLTGDILWYSLGATAGLKFMARFGKYFALTEAHVTRVTELFQDHTHKILILSKLTTGLGFAPVVLFTAGLARVPFRTYLSLNMLGQFVWSGALLGVGFFFGHAYSLLDTGLKRLSFIAASIVIVVAIVRYGIYLRSKIMRDRSSHL